MMRVATKAGTVAPIPCEGQVRHKNPCDGLQPGVIRQVTAEGGDDGGENLPIKESEQVMAQGCACGT